MKKSAFELLFLLTVPLAWYSCAHGGFGSNSFGSVTYIEPNKSFELGKGQHGSYTAIITNKGDTRIEVTTETLEGSRKLIGTLKPYQKATYTIPENTTAYFENQGSQQATIAIEITGAPQLSMGYRDNR